MDAIRSSGLIWRILVAAVALAAGCQAAQRHRHGAATASVVRAAPMCGGEGEEAGARWIPTEGALHAALLSAGGVQDGEPPKIDFGRDGVVLVSMGQQRTAGYSLALHDANVPVADGVATVVVAFETPPPGAMVAQVLTSPCLLVRLPKEGIREVRIVDPSGALRAAVAIPGRAQVERPPRP